MIYMIKNAAFLLVFSLLLISCDSNQEKHRKTVEERLIDSYALADKSTRQRVDIIVGASKEKNYKLAMNELGILSATQLNDASQKYAIKRLMEQLRFNLDEQDLAQKAKIKDDS